MTSSSDESARPEESDPTNDAPKENSVDEHAKKTGDVTATGNSGQTSTDGETKQDEDLPEWEPLTPELVEDEAIRGDFMLRWAVILLAVLLGCSQIGESETLVHIKTGQYLAANGLLPPANDVLSSTAGDRPWTNLSWLFDLIVASVYSIAGGFGLSLLTALLAGIAWYLISSTSRPGVSTWWGSIVAALALIVCYPQFTARPELVTIVGLALVLWMLRRWKDSQSAGSLWGLVAVFFVWSNIDPRMFLGLAALTLYAAGECAGNAIGRPGIADASKRKHLWVVVGCCFAASMVNPFLWESLAAPSSLYGAEYPALRDYNPIDMNAPVRPSIERLQFYPMLSERFWNWITHHAASGMVVVLAAIIACVLNRAKLDFGHVFLLGGFLGFALVASHELAAASVVGCVVATLNIQQWYRDNFRQTYSVEMSELVFSRGGRAVTVLVLFAVAFLAVSGRMAGPDDNGIGFGFSDSLRATSEGLQSSLEDSFDEKPFNFRLSQGDHLIWIGKQPFVDSRVKVFSGAGDNNILKSHNEIRYALLRSRQNDDRTGRPDIWKPAFDRHGITHVIPRLAGVAPDYETYLDLLTSGDWQPTKLEAIAAVFYRRDSGNVALEKYLKGRELNFITTAFEEESKPAPPRVDWAKAKTAYDKFFHAERRVVSNPIQQARHLMRHMSLFRRDQRSQAALAYLIIRTLNEGLADSQDSAEAFQILGQAYTFLRNFEVQICRSTGFDFPNEMRFLQSLNAFSQSLVLEPDNPAIYEILINTYSSVNKLDLTLQALHRLEELTENRTELTEQQLAQKKRYLELEEELSRQAEQVIITIDQKLEQETNPFELAQDAHLQGYVLQAVRILELNQVAVAENPAAQHLLGVSFMQLGRLDEASAIFAKLESLNPQATMGLNWRSPAAAVAIARADYDRAIKLYSDSIEFQEATQVTKLLHTLPMNQTPMMFFSPGHIDWPVERSLLWPVAQWRETQVQSGSIEQTAMKYWHIAICNLEAGRIEDATKAFRTILETNAETPLRPLVTFYLYQVAQELIDVEPPSDWIPDSADMFASDESGAKQN